MPPKDIPTTALTIKSAKGILRVLICDLIISDSVSKKQISVKAIWDTGATGTVITKNIAAHLGVNPSGKVMVSTANGIVPQNTYIVSVILPNNIQINGITVTEVDALSGGCEALIGMDIITCGDFSITNFNGDTCMSFRVPSNEQTDFVKKINATNNIRIAHANAGRNENSMCICGGGKKFKNCHGKK